MILGTVQGSIASVLGFDNPRDVKIDQSFYFDLEMTEEQVREVLVELQSEVDIDLVTRQKKFEFVEDLVDFIDVRR